jgi:hypothetical protein
MKKISFVRAEVIGKRLVVNIAGKEFYRDYDDHERAIEAMEHVLEFGLALGFRDVLKTRK